MKIKGFYACLMLSSFFIVLSCLPAPAQVTPGRLGAIKSRLDPLKRFWERMPENQRRFLSSGALNLFQFANRFDELEKGLHRISLRPDLVPGGAPQNPLTGASTGPTGAVANVSNPSQDIFSVLSGFTQSETDTDGATTTL
jgi:hypothetical protein